MRFVSIRQLKATPSEFLRRAAKGETVVIAYRGKPTAVLRGISEEELEDYLLENNPKVRK
jgi:prevent-host-death family protein